MVSLINNHFCLLLSVGELGGRGEFCCPLEPQVQALSLLAEVSVGAFVEVSVEVSVEASAVRKQETPARSRLTHALSFKLQNFA